MGEAVRDWLPTNAFTDEAIRAVLCNTVASWSACWFARATAEISAVRTGEPAPAADPKQLVISGRHTKAQLSAAGKRHVLQVSLGVDLSAQLLWETDRHVLDTFLEQAVKDLVERIDAALNAGSACDGGRYAALDISFGSNEGFKLYIPDHLLVGALKAGFGKPRIGSAPTNRLDVLRRTRLSAFGFMGRAELSIGEARDMAVGDIVVLDQSLDEPVELRLAGVGPPLARGKLCCNDGQFSIQL
jgi:Type III flagellar switch regulator (C-ring) FliN C-term